MVTEGQGDRPTPTSGEGRGRVGALPQVTQRTHNLGKYKQNAVTITGTDTHLPMERLLDVVSKAPQSIGQQHGWPRPCGWADIGCPSLGRPVRIVCYKSEQQAAMVAEGLRADPTVLAQLGIRQRNVKCGLLSRKPAAHRPNAVLSRLVSCPAGAEVASGLVAAIAWDEGQVDVCAAVLSAAELLWDSAVEGQEVEPAGGAGGETAPAAQRPFPPSPFSPDGEGDDNSSQGRVSPAPPLVRQPQPLGHPSPTVLPARSRGRQAERCEPAVSDLDGVLPTRETRPSLDERSCPVGTHGAFAPLAARVAAQVERVSRDDSAAVVRALAVPVPVVDGLVDGKPVPTRLRYTRQNSQRHWEDGRHELTWSEAVQTGTGPAFQTPTVCLGCGIVLEATAIHNHALEACSALFGCAADWAFIQPGLGQPLPVTKAMSDLLSLVVTGLTPGQLDFHRRRFARFSEVWRQATGPWSVGAHGGIKYESPTGDVQPGDVLCLGCYVTFDTASLAQHLLVADFYVWRDRLSIPCSAGVGCTVVTPSLLAWAQGQPDVTVRAALASYGQAVCGGRPGTDDVCFNRELAMAAQYRTELSRAVQRCFPWTAGDAGAGELWEDVWQLVSERDQSRPGFGLSPFLQQQQGSQAPGATAATTVRPWLSFPDTSRYRSFSRWCPTVADVTVSLELLNEVGTVVTPATSGPQVQHVAQEQRVLLPCGLPHLRGGDGETTVHVMGAALCLSCGELFEESERQAHGLQVKEACERACVPDYIGCSAPGSVITLGHDVVVTDSEREWLSRAVTGLPRAQMAREKQSVAALIDTGVSALQGAVEWQYAGGSHEGMWDLECISAPVSAKEGDVICLSCQSIMTAKGFVAHVIMSAFFITRHRMRLSCNLGSGVVVVTKALLAALSMGSDESELYGEDGWSTLMQRRLVALATDLAPAGGASLEQRNVEYRRALQRQLLSTAAVRDVLEAWQLGTRLPELEAMLTAVTFRDSYRPELLLPPQHSLAVREPQGTDVRRTPQHRDGEEVGGVERREEAGGDGLDRAEERARPSEREGQRLSVIRLQEPPVAADSQGPGCRLEASLPVDTWNGHDDGDGVTDVMTSADVMGGEGGVEEVNCKAPVARVTASAWEARKRALDATFPPPSSTIAQRMKSVLDQVVARRRSPAARVEATAAAAESRDVVTAQHVVCSGCGSVRTTKSLASHRTKARKELEQGKGGPTVAACAAKYTATPLPMHDQVVADAIRAGDHGGIRERTRALWRAGEILPGSGGSHQQAAGQPATPAATITVAAATTPGPATTPQSPVPRQDGDSGPASSPVSSQSQSQRRRCITTAHVQCAGCGVLRQRDAQNNHRSDSKKDGSRAVQLCGQRDNVMPAPFDDAEFSRLVEAGEFDTAQRRATALWQGMSTVVLRQKLAEGRKRRRRVFEPVVHAEGSTPVGLHTRARSLHRKQNVQKPGKEEASCGTSETSSDHLQPAGKADSEEEDDDGDGLEETSDGEGEDVIRVGREEDYIAEEEDAGLEEVGVAVTVTGEDSGRGADADHVPGLDYRSGVAGTSAVAALTVAAETDLSPRGDVGGGTATASQAEELLTPVVRGRDSDTEEEFDLGDLPDVWTAELIDQGPPIPPITPPSPFTPQAALLASLAAGGGTTPSTAEVTEFKSLLGQLAPSIQHAHSVLLQREPAGGPGGGPSVAERELGAGVQPAATVARPAPAPAGPRGTASVPVRVPEIPVAPSVLESMVAAYCTDCGVWPVPFAEPSGSTRRLADRLTWPPTGPPLLWFWVPLLTHAVTGEPNPDALKLEWVFGPVYRAVVTACRVNFQLRGLERGDVGVDVLELSDAELGMLFDPGFVKGMTAMRRARTAAGRKASRTRNNLPAIVYQCAEWMVDMVQPEVGDGVEGIEGKPRKRQQAPRASPAPQHDAKKRHHAL